MRFANYHFEPQSLNNLGDNLQLIAIDHIYSRMGIAKEEILQIDKNELATYSGEYAILPVSMPLTDYVEGGISKRFSPHIIPVFLGFTMLTDSLMPEEVEYLRLYAPIGCRDERTLQIVRKYNIPAYLNGCVTITLPDAKVDRTKLETVFLIDIPPALETHIPKEILAKAKRGTHIFEGSLEDSKAEAIRVYEMYKQEAALVVTSLLHCSSPCIAAGIPVIIAKTQCSYRFGWLDKIAPIYTEEEFDQIDWSPKPLEYEAHKERVLQNAIQMLNSAYKKYSACMDISYYYQNREKKSYIVDTFASVKEFIDDNWNPNEVYRYAVWGMTQLTQLVVEYIKKNYPKAVLTHIYDKNRSVVFEGISTEPFREFPEDPEQYIFVTAIAAAEDAKKAMKDFNKNPDKLCIAKIVL